MRWKKERNRGTGSVGRLKGNTTPGVGKNQRRRAVDEKQENEYGLDITADAFGNEEPEAGEETGQEADPGGSREAESQCGPQTDIAPEMKHTSGVIPIPQIPDGIQKPSGCQFPDCPEDSGQEEHGSRMLFLLYQQKVEKYGADAVNWKPRAVKKTAVPETVLFYEKDQDFPEETCRRAHEKEKNQL